ncbi:MAG: 50S ribosomal protein L6 [Bdellovibrionales bacterium]
MSRVGNAPVYFDDKVNVNITPDNTVVVKSGKNRLSVKIDPVIKPSIEDGKIVFNRENNEPQTRAYHGLYRALVQNAVTGVSTGWTKELELNGVGLQSRRKW